QCPPFFFTSPRPSSKGGHGWASPGMVMGPLSRVPQSCSPLSLVQPTFAPHLSGSDQLGGYPERQWEEPVCWSEKPSQALDVVEKGSPPAGGRLEGETKGEVEFHFTIFDDPEEVGFSQGPEDYPIWESPFKPAMYQGDYPKEDWDASINSLGDVFEASFQQQFYSGGRVYPCTECGRIFNRKSTLTRHWRTHTGEKPYSCLDCGRSFSLNLNLLTHQMTHTGEKPYKCPDCGQSFTRSTSVTRHQRSHREESMETYPEAFGKCYLMCKPDV
uniref:C2H2-type domain-containing protein n=1 Tax=Varanus komodoensis TaxID=61221 RepID=A0A8D2LJQ9_VARKO